MTVLPPTASIAFEDLGRSQREFCHYSATPPSARSMCFNRNGEGASAEWQNSCQRLQRHQPVRRHIQPIEGQCTHTHHWPMGRVSLRWRRARGKTRSSAHPPAGELHAAERHSADPRRTATTWCSANTGKHAHRTTLEKLGQGGAQPRKAGAEGHSGQVT